MINPNSVLTTLQNTFDFAGASNDMTQRAAKNTPKLEKLEGIPEATPDASPEKTLDDFATVFKNSIAEVNQLSQQADTLAQDYALGKDVPLHQVMIASEKASVSMELTTQIRNKLVQAYQDIMHMPL